MVEFELTVRETEGSAEDRGIRNHVPYPKERAVTQF